MGKSLREPTDRAVGDKTGWPYEEARDYLDHLISGKVVRVDAYGSDRYKRVLAVIWDEQTNVNLLMVAMGYAEGYRGARCQAYCRELDQAEAKARRDGVGMWAQGASYESPAIFRFGGATSNSHRRCQIMKGMGEG